MTCYGYEQTKWRRLIFERDHFKCRTCGSTSYIELAHVTGYGYSYDNLVTLCHDCHNAYHRSKRGFHQNGFNYERVRRVNKLFYELLQLKKQRQIEECVHSG